MLNTTTRRGFLRSAGLTALAAPAAVQCLAAPARKDGLNVLLIMTDEQHFRSLSATGSPYIETPNMDRLVHAGARFENATCVTPYCSPSRASILTGLYPHRHGVLHNVSPTRNTQEPLAPDAFPNTECLLHEQGYAMGHRGKWHLGKTGDFACYEQLGYVGKAGEYHQFLEERLPKARFADDRDPGRYLGRPVAKIPAVRKGWKAFNEVPKNGVAYIATIGRTVVPPELLPETRITSQVLDLLDACADRNFMITVSWSPPHDLWVMPEPYYSMVDRRTIALPGTTELPRWDQRGMSKRLGDLMGLDGIREYAAIYHGMVKYIDDQLGRVLRKIDELGLAERTLIIFTSDHGDMVGAHGCIGKSISSFFDDLVRIPLLLQLPGTIKPGTVIKEPVSQVDFMPTILDYVGLPIPQGIHGRSLRPLLEGKPSAWRDYAFCQRADRLRMLRTDRYKYAYGVKGTMLALYDLHGDPNEDRNLAPEDRHAGTVRRMHTRLLEVMRQDGDPLVSEFPDDPLA